MENIWNSTKSKQKSSIGLNQNDPTDDELLPDEDNNSSEQQISTLEPGDPLLEKFQRTLKAHLLKVNADLTNDIADLDHKIKRLNADCENIGAELYDKQEEIENQKDILDNYNNQIKTISQKRLKCEQNSSQHKREFHQINNEYKQANRVHEERLMELTNVNRLEKNIIKWTEEIETEVMTAQRMISKDEQNQLIISQQKKQMDLLLFNLDSECRRGDRQLANINQQLAEQQSILNVLNQSIMEANTDLNALNIEQKRLMNSWNDTILAIKLRNSQLATYRADLNHIREQYKLEQANLQSIKKASAKEMENGEKFESIKMKILFDIQNLNNQLTKDTSEIEDLVRQIDGINILISQTELDLSKANTEGQIIENHLRSLNRLLEKQLQQKCQLEEKILNLLQDQISMGQASNNQAKHLRESQEHRRNLEIQMLTTEQQLSSLLFDMENCKAMIGKSKDTIQKLQSEKDIEINKVTNILNEVKSTEQSINIKYKLSDKINRELAILIEAAGGQEIDPFEVRLIAVEKNIADIENQIKDSQTFWTRLQAHVVNLTETQSQQLKSINLARRQLMVIGQKTIKIDAELMELNTIEVETNREIKNLYHQINILSAKLFEKKKYHETEEVDCELSHKLLIDHLKTEEMIILNLEAELNQLANDIEATKLVVQEKHHEALTWETKWKMAQETRKYRELETTGQSEIGLMKSEIHRMEVRYQQLRRAQDKLIQDMQHCVEYRDHIFDDANLRSKLPDAKSKSRFTIQHRLNDLKNKYKHILTEISSIRRMVNELIAHREAGEINLKTLTQAMNNERMQDMMLQNEIDQSILMKHENLENIVRIQQRAKRYRHLLNLKQLPKCHSETKLIADTDRQQEVNNHLLGILETLIVEYPDHQMSIKRVLQTLRGYDDQ